MEKKVDIKMQLVYELLEEKIDYAFDVSECSYDHYPVEEVEKQTAILPKLLKMTKLLREIYEEELL